MSIEKAINGSEALPEDANEGEGRKGDEMLEEGKVFNPAEDVDLDPG